CLVNFDQSPGQPPVILLTGRNLKSASLSSQPTLRDYVAAQVIVSQVDFGGRRPASNARRSGSCSSRTCSQAFPSKPNCCDWQLSSPPLWNRYLYYRPV